MLKLLKYLKKSALALVFVTVLLITQAYCDLSLPTYTSQIINVGIMQGGITDAAPEAIRASEMEKVLLFLTQEDRDVVLSHYTLIDKEAMNESALASYKMKYPLVETEALYVRDKDKTELLNDIMSIPLMLIIESERGSQAPEEGQNNLSSMFPPNMADEGMDLFTVLSVMPEELRTDFLTSMYTKLAEMPEAIITQTASHFTKTEYEIIGINLSKIQTKYILSVGAKMIGLAMAAMAASILVTYIASRIAAKLGRDLRGSVFRKVLGFSNAEMDQFSTASLITRSTNDIQQVQMLIVMMIRIVIYSPILALGGLFKVITTNTSMTWTLGVGVGAVFALILTLLFIAMPKFKVMQKLVDRINLVTREILTGLPVIRAFSTEQHEKERFDKANVDITRNTLFVSRVMTFMMPSLMLIMNLVSVLILWVGAHQISEGSMQVGDMIAFIQYTMQIIMSFLMLTMISVMLPRAGVAAKRIDEILTVDEVIHDPEQEELSSTKQKGLVEFQNVSFRYPGAEEDVLSDISFVAKPGETTAIIGSTGSGKSTLIHLIPRFYDVVGGTIKVNGQDIRKLKLRTLRDKLGFVPQKGVLFSGTINSNISFGVPDAAKEVVEQAAQIAQATDFINEKPEGYDSPISQGGTNVSGGQKQRLSIARAIAKKPEVYIFDDSFSALDYKTDATLRKTLKEKLADSTLIIVAQRINTIMNAEQILVLDEGRIVGKGTHKELLRSCEVYQQIASSQLSKEELSHE